MEDKIPPYSVFLFLKPSIFLASLFCALSACISAVEMQYSKASYDFVNYTTEENF